MPQNTQWTKYTPISVKDALKNKKDTAFDLNNDSDREFLLARLSKSKELYNKPPVYLDLAFRLFEKYKAHLDIILSFSKKSEAKYLKIGKKGATRRSDVLIIRFATHEPKNYRSFDYTYSPVQKNSMEHRKVDYRKCLHVILDWLIKEGLEDKKGGNA
jgi:hypothetical protein